MDSPDVSKISVLHNEQANLSNLNTSNPLKNSHLLKSQSSKEKNSSGKSKEKEAVNLSGEMMLGEMNDDYTIDNPETMPEEEDGDDDPEILEEIDRR